MKSGDSGRWVAVGSVVTGAMHLRREQLCQDALYVSEAGPEFAIACVADGHGSEACPHSDLGAEIAVQIAADLLVDMLPNLSDHKDIWLPKQIETKWKEAVKTLHANEFTSGAPQTDFETSTEAAHTADGVAAPQAPFSYIQYGTTPLALAATESFVFALQIGDGDILMVGNDGTPRPVLAKPEKVGEDTESLCLDEAWRHVRTQVIPWSAVDGPPMFILSTDGYSNSFADSAGFLKAGEDFYSLWREEGLTYLAENLEDWLRRSSDKGSGDDIALALVVFEN